MNPPFYRVAAASARVVALLGEPPRVYPWGQRDDDEPQKYPYVTFQVVSGNPENFLNGRPDADRTTLQVDIWAGSAASARSVAMAIRDAIELDCYIVAWRGESKDAETGSFRISFDCDWITRRS